MSEVRDQIGSALSDKLTADQLTLLMEEILAIKKGARGWCPNCNKAVMVEVSDAKAVAGAIKDLSAEAWGRPSDDKVEAEGITFTRVVRYGGAE